MVGTRTNRRIGQRHALQGLRVGWYVEGRAPRRHLFRRVDMQPTAQVVDVSASGARVVTTVRPVVSVGTLVLVTLDDEATMVEVRRAGALPDGRADYGVQFLDPDNPLARLVHERLDQMAPSARAFWDGVR